MLNTRQLASLLFLTAAICSGAATFSSASTFSGPANLTWEAERLLEFKQGLSQADDSLSRWSSSNLAGLCYTWQGVICSSINTINTTVTGLNFTDFNVSGQLTSPLCDLPNLAELRIRNNSINQSFPAFLLQSCRELTVLDFSLNMFHGQLPSNISASLSKLEQFNMEGNSFEGEIAADFGNLSQLRLLRLRGNYLSGLIPRELGRLSFLQILDLSWNSFPPQKIPQELGNLSSSLLELDLPGCDLIDEIPASLGNFSHLWFLDLSQNQLSGTIPPSLANLSNLTQLYLFQNLLSGHLPPLSNLTRLTIAQFQNNSLSGSIPAGFASLSSLTELSLDGNQLTGPLPDGLASLPLSTFVVSRNNLSGNLSTQWGLNSTLFQFDVTENSFTGSFPPHLCARNGLQYLSLQNNLISGEIPVEYENCNSVLRFIVNGNQLSGSVPSGLWTLRSVQVLMLRNNNLSGKIVLSNYDPSAKYGSLQSVLIESNQFEGPIPSQVGQFWPNLTKLSATGNRLSGPLPLEIGHLTNLQELDLSGNSISGEIPTSIGGCDALTSIDLSRNELSGPIPTELSQISNLNYLNLSMNNLNGSIPTVLAKHSFVIFDVSYNDLSGTVPEQLQEGGFNSTIYKGNPKLCPSQSCNSLTVKGSDTSTKLVVPIVVLGACAILLCIALIVRMYRKKLGKGRVEVANDWTVVSFQRLELNEEELYESLDERNVIGLGGSGRVYKVLLQSGGKAVAVKKLTPTSATLNCRGMSAMANSGGVHVNRRDENSAFKAEMEILGKIKHKNIVNLMCSCASKEAKLLVYEYMCNGSLGDVLHKTFRNELLCWATRFEIALGAAEGLAYLHHDCVPPILHRDIKSNNILLDSSFHAKLADFGVAKSFQARGTSMTGVVGSFGYIAPEYAYTLKVDEKSDVYSYGVVLLELVTGRSPASKELESEGIDLVRWVGQLAQSREGLLKVFDCRLEVGESDKESIFNVLKLALLCTCVFPRQRPSMREVVELLHRATPISRIVSHQHQQSFWHKDKDISVSILT